MPRVVITIGEDGDSEIKVEGGHGPSCHDLTKAFRKLGKEVESKNLPEFYEKPVNTKVTVGR